MPLIAINRSNSVSSSAVANPNNASWSSRTCVCTRRLISDSGVARSVKGRQGNGEVVADTADVNDHAIGMLFEHAPSQKRDHARGRGRY